MSRTYLATLATLVASSTFLEQAEALDLLTGLVLVTTTLATLWGRWKAGGVNVWGKRA